MTLKEAQMGEQIIFSANKERANNYIVWKVPKYLSKIRSHK